MGKLIQTIFLGLGALSLLALSSCQKSVEIDQAVTDISQLQRDKPYAYSRPEVVSAELLADLDKTYKELNSFIWLNDAVKTETVFASLVEKTDETFPNEIVLQALARNNLGVAYIILGEPDKALKPLSTALEMLSVSESETNIYQDGRYRALSNLAEAHLRLDNIDQAKDYFEQALKLNTPFLPATPEQIENGVRFLMAVPKWEDEYLASPETVLMKAGITPDAGARKAAIDQYYVVIEALGSGDQGHIVANLKTYYELMKKAHHPRSRFIYSAHGNYGGVLAVFAPQEDFEQYFKLSLATGGKYGYETKFDIENITIGLLNFTSHYVNRNEFEKALTYFNEARRRIEDNLAPDNAARIVLYTQLHLMNLARGDYEKALQYANLLNETTKLRGHEKQVDYFLLRSKYANMLSYNERFKEADREYLEIISEAEALGDDGNQHLYFVGSGYAINLLAQGRYAECISIAETLLEKIHLADHVNDRVTSEVYGTIALAYSAMGQHKEALLYEGKSNSLGLEIYKGMTAVTARYEVNRISTHFNAGEYEAAQSQIDQSLSQRENDVTKVSAIPLIRTWQARLFERGDQTEKALSEYDWIDRFYEDKKSDASKANHRAVQMSQYRLQAKMKLRPMDGILSDVENILTKIDEDRRDLQNIYNNTQAANRSHQSLYEAGLDAAYSAQDEDYAFQMFQRIMSHGVGYISRQAKNRLLNNTPKLEAQYKKLDLLKVELSAAKVESYKLFGGDSQRLAVVNKKILRLEKDVSELEQALQSSLAKGVSIGDRLSLKEVQSALKEDEAMLLVTDSPYGLYSMTVSRDGAALNRSSLKSYDVKPLIKSLRDSLRIDDARQELPEFDDASATQLSQAIFSEEIVKQLESKSVIKSLSANQLSKLPLSVLTWPQTDNALQNTFFGEFFALQTLVDFDIRPKKNRKTKTQGFLGIGAPSITADGDDTPVLTASAPPPLFPSSANGPGQTYILRGSAGVTRIADLPELENSLQEMQNVAQSLSYKTELILSGAEANEAIVKSLDLKDYSVVLIATHGLVAGEISQNSEPALVMSANDDDPFDDSLLSMSEIMNLDMTADLVILSACNTAAGGRESAPGLTGLASAFLYAGADSLLASHWPVRDDAAAFLTVNTVKNTHAGMSKAKALQIAMRELRESPDISDSSHPAIWAPFVLVGE
ncbi:MAG: CHAT domain-containing protein [Hellea sp.]